MHGEAATAAVEHASQALFGRGELTELDEPTLAAALREAAVAELKPGGPDAITDLLVASGLSASKGAARRTIGEGGVYGQQRADRQRGVGAATGGLPARPLAGTAPRQAEYRRGRAGWMRSYARVGESKRHVLSAPFDSEFSLT